MPEFQTVVSPDVVDVLRHEQERIRQLGDAVREADLDRRPHALAVLRQAVHLHQLGETAVAYPAVCDCGPDGGEIARGCRAEGERIERALGDLERLGTADAGFDAGIEALTGALSDHAARQERDEFPLLRRYVTTQRLHMMAGAMHDVQAMARTDAEAKPEQA